MTSHTGTQVIVIHILPNISRRKGNHTIKFSHLITYKVKNIFLQKLWQTSPRPPFVF